MTMSLMLLISGLRRTKGKGFTAQRTKVHGAGSPACRQFTRLLHNASTLRLALEETIEKGRKVPQIRAEPEVEPWFKMLRIAQNRTDVV